jgi:hypothetical protein
MPTLLLLIAVVLLAGSAWAQELDKSQSVTIEKDSKTRSWTGFCAAALGGLDPRQTYSGRFLLIFTPNVGSPVNVIDATWQVDPQNRTWTASSPGISQFTARLAGQDVSLDGVVNLTSLHFASGESILCSTRFDRGPASAPSEQGIFGADHRATLQSSP